MVIRWPVGSSVPPSSGWQDPLHFYCQAQNQTPNDRIRFDFLCLSGVPLCFFRDSGGFNAPCVLSYYGVIFQADLCSGLTKGQGPYNCKAFWYRRFLCAKTVLSAECFRHRHPATSPVSMLRVKMRIVHSDDPFRIGVSQLNSTIRFITMDTFYYCKFILQCAKIIFWN